MANLDASLPQSVQSVNNPETPTAELNEAIIDLPAPSLAPTVNKPATLTIEIIETLPPSPAQFENKSATLAIVAIDLNNTNLDIPPFCPCPPERANIDLPSLCPLSAEAKSPTLAIDVEEGLQTPMTTDNALSVPGNEDDATLPADEMAIEGTRLFSLSNTITARLFTAFTETIYGFNRVEAAAGFHSVWMSLVYNIMPVHASCCGLVRSRDRAAVRLELRTTTLRRKRLRKSL